ncbi:MarR family winged helix-turn-helix transcriptional regulator [Desulfosarcina cetonica]|uniref:MarR family winged helix-turn-helix transcriptional regulator n=1 Tax=Desulfosarcina cetonica TaxID=90730 RepID=UPI001C472E39|nr:helix-turn-helix domain-containing protein [Desulfosarcina cetonica]
MDTKEDLIRHAIYGLLRIAHLYARIEAMPIPVNDQTSVSTREAHTLQAIGEEVGNSVTQVAHHFGITKSAASQLVAKLEKRGFLHKRPAAHSNKEFELFFDRTGVVRFSCPRAFPR